MSDVVFIARCPEHGLHGERDECFVCGGPVEKVAMFPVGAEHGAEGLVHEAESILRASAAFDRSARIYEVLSELGRRLRNGGQTIAAYQQLTHTDYPGTLAARLANGHIVIRGRAQHPPVGCTEHAMQDPTCAWCRAHAIEYARAGGSTDTEVADLRRRADELDRQLLVVREGAARLRPLARRAITEPGASGDEARRELHEAIDFLARGRA